MTFAHPLMLLGALAALLPLLIHLFDRRRPRPIPFGPIAFVLRSQRRTASRLKLKRLLLYLLRTLILLAIPVALARPQFSKPAAAVTAAKGPAATAVVLDASLSMRWSDGKSLFALGQERARAALRGLLPEEPAVFLLCGQNPKPPLPLSFERAKLRAAVDAAQPGYGAQPLNGCLELAAHALEESPLAARRIILVSDFTQNALRLESPLPQIRGPDQKPTRPEVVLEEVGTDKNLSNHALVDLKIQPATPQGPRAFQFLSTVRNFGSAAAKDLEATLRLQEAAVAKGFLEVAAGGTAQKAITHRFEQGGPVAGELALTPDGLADDDKRAFLLWVPQDIRALVVNGSPNSVRYRDEAFFVEAALNAPGSPVRPSLRDADAAFREDLSQYQLVFLLNVPAPSKEAALKLEEFVKAGGGLFVSMGDQVEPETYNAAFAGLLSRKLRVVKTAARQDDPDAPRKAARLVQVDESHPLFQPFAGKAGEGLLSSLFYRYVLMESAGGQHRPDQVLASFGDGAPALLLSKFGKGRVLFFTSTVDRDWSDFSIRTSFLPFLHRAANLLSGSLEERESKTVRVGETVGLHPSAPVAHIRAPSGAADPFSPPDEEGRIKVGPLLEPGLHLPEDAAGKVLLADGVAAVLDPAESDLRRLPADGLAGYFGEGSVKHGSAEGTQPRIPPWTWLIVLAVAAFFAEGLLLGK